MFVATKPTERAPRVKSRPARVKRSRRHARRRRQARTQRQHALQQQIHDDRATMSLQFKDVLASERRGCLEIQGETLVDWLPGSIFEAGQQSVTWLREPAEQRLRDTRGATT